MFFGDFMPPLHMQILKMETIGRIVVIVSLAITSCIPYKELNIQVLNKPELKIPNDFKKPLILVNLYPKYGIDKRSRMEWDLDSVAATEAAYSLSEMLANSPWFNGFSTPVGYYSRRDTSKVIKQLGWNTLRSITANDSTDLIISLEYMKVDPEVNAYPTWEGEMKYYVGYLEYPVYCYWRIYDLNRKQVPSGYLYRDTLIWDAKDWVEIRVGDQLPGYFSAAAYAGHDVATKYASMIAPVWSDDLRKIFHSGSREMQTAYGFARNGEWIDAAAQWQRIIAARKGKLAAKAAFNLALANEMLGNFDIALEWLRQAKKSDPFLLEIDEYKTVIESRLETPK